MPHVCAQPMLRADMRLLLVAAVAAAVLLPAAPAPAFTMAVEGGTLVVRADAGEHLAAKIGTTTAPCHYRTQPPGQYVGEPTGTLDDPAGCVFFLSLNDRAAINPGPGCSEVVVPSMGDPMPVANEACGLTGVQRIEVHGSPGADRIQFEPGFSTSLPVSVAAGDGSDEVDTRDRAVQVVDCGAGTDTSWEDPADRSTGCEEGVATPEGTSGDRGARGTVRRRGDVVVVDLAARRSKAGLSLGHRPQPERRFDNGRETLLPAGFRLVGTGGAGLPMPGEGCTAEGGSALESAFCPLPVRAVEVAGPRNAHLHLESTLGEADGAPPVTVRAGAEPDWLQLADGAPQRIAACGAGADTVEVDGRDEVAGDCEVVTTPKGGSPRFAALRMGTVGRRGAAVHGRLFGRQSQGVRVPIRCPVSASTGCGGVLEGMFGAVPFGSTSYWVPAGRTTEFDLIVGVGKGRFGSVPEATVKQLFYAKAGRGTLRARVRTRIHDRTSGWRTVALRRLRHTNRGKGMPNGLPGR